MSLVGYDGDRQVYSYQDRDGNAWEGEQGNRHGHLHRTGGGYVDKSSERLDKPAWHYVLPFVVIICLTLFGTFYFLSGPPAPLLCGDGLRAYRVRSTDTCSKISNKWETTIVELERLNPEMDCDRLTIGRKMCVPRPIKQVIEN